MKIHQFITKNYFLIALGIVLVTFLLVVVLAYAQEQQNTDNEPYGHNDYNNNMRMGDDMGQGTNRRQSENRDEYEHLEELPPSDTELTQQAKDAIYKALDDEYKARATYQAVINDFGNVRPFSMIIRAEAKHISSLVLLLNNYNLDVPANPYNNLTAKDTLADNCSVGVQAEIDNANLYKDQLLPVVSAYPDITATFTNLMNASQQKHLPAFTRCAN